MKRSKIVLTIFLTVIFGFLIVLYLIGKSASSNQETSHPSPTIITENSLETLKSGFINGCIKADSLHGNDYCNCAWNYITTNTSKNSMKLASNSPEMKKM